jgi:hypothetical protein
MIQYDSMLSGMIFDAVDRAIAMIYFNLLGFYAPPSTAFGVAFSVVRIFRFLLTSIIFNLRGKTYGNVFWLEVIVG